MTKRDIAGYLGIDTKTLYNWEKDKPNLYKTVMKGLAYDEIVELNKKTYEKAKEMSEKFEKWEYIKGVIVYKIFDRDIVLKSLENNDYFIHTKTSNEAREEVNRLCDDLSDFFNDFYGLENDEYNESRIIVSSQELSPSCNYGLIYRSDKFNTFFLKEHLDEQLIIKEIESYRI